MTEAGASWGSDNVGKSSSMSITSSRPSSSLEEQEDKHMNMTVSWSRLQTVGPVLHRPRVICVFIHVIEDFVWAALCWGVPCVQFDLPEFDLLVPRPSAVLPELIGSLWVNPRLTHVPGNNNGKRKKIKQWKLVSLFFYLENMHLCQNIFRLLCVCLLGDFFDVSVIGQSVLPIVYLFLSP